MKKNYNRDVVSDMPIDTSFTPPVETRTQKKTTTKPKINVIGKQNKKEQNTSSVKSDVSSKKLRTKLVKADNDLDDLEKLNEENIKAYRFKNKRNKVVIAILSVLLLISIATITTFGAISKL
ncbi:MAG: hypothetical protein IKY10_00770, partial [Clostridia bacterium]|nr:hypothetical protein [Clostridia bacterium]